MRVHEVEIADGQINLWPLRLTPDRVAFHAERPRWEAERLADCHRVLEPGMVVYDIGAECGDFTALYGSWGCEVVPIEPQPRYWPAIRAHLDANQITPLSGFVGFAARRTELHPRHSDIRGCLALAGGSWPPCAYGKLAPDFGFRHLAQQADSTPTLSIDNYDLLRCPPPDALMIDVEGAEWDVLQGAASVLTQYRPIVWVSASPETMKEWYGAELSDLHAYMAGFGYEAELLAVGHEQWWRYA